MGAHQLLGRINRRVLAFRRKRQRLREFKRISASKQFNAPFYLGRKTTPEEEYAAIDEYLTASKNDVPRGKQNPGAAQRRPILGFHPAIYAAACNAFYESEGEDPLAHYLRTGMPGGPWNHAVIQPRQPVSPERIGQRILIHGHFHYPDLIEDFLISTCEQCVDGRSSYHHNERSQGC